MISANCAAVALLTVAGTSIAAAIPQESGEVISIPSRTTSWATPPTGNSTITPGPTSSKPWYLEAFSNEFIGEAIALRSPGVPESKAYSVAKHLVDYGLAPQQYTSIIQQGLEMWVNDGSNPNATSLYNIATEAMTAYEQVHNEIGYWAYVDYVQTTAASVFDPALLRPTAEPHLTGSAASRARKNREHATEVYSSLYADPSGSAALSILSEVCTSYRHDFEPQDQNVAVMQTTSMIERIMSNLLNLI